jgi:hypothetical protein
MRIDYMDSSLARGTEPEHVFLFAHQDDEFGVFPLIDVLSRSSQKIRCIFLTDGGGSGADANVRNDESRRVLKSYGIVEDCVIFLGTELAIGDGKLHQNLEKVSCALAMLLKDYQTGTMYLPAYEGGHHDHDCVNALGVLLGQTRPGVACKQFPLYHGKGLSGPWFKVIAPIAENGKFEVMKYSAVSALKYCFSCFRYRSQWRTWLGIWPFFFYISVTRRELILQKASTRVFFERPHLGSLFYERRFGIRYEVLAAALTTLRIDAE